MNWLEWFELGSYLVTIVGLPLAIIVFVAEQRKSNRQEEAEIFQRLSDDYSNFLELAIQNSDLGLLRRGQHDETLTEDQQERKQAMLGLLIALFERAFILLYEEGMSEQRNRQWATWEDYMRDWCRREDFRRALPELLEGEDAAFAAHIRRIAGGFRESTAASVAV
jgi:hypothetical protein